MMFVDVNRPGFVSLWTEMAHDFPACSDATPRWSVMVVLPVPPFCERTAIIFMRGLSLCHMDTCIHVEMCGCGYADVWTGGSVAGGEGECHKKDHTAGVGCWWG